MEEILIVIFQALFELALQVLAELPWEWVVGSGEDWPHEESRSTLWVVLSLVMGGVVGAVSLLLLPNTLIRSSIGRMANLIIAPVVSGSLSYFFSRLRARRGEDATDPRFRAVCATCFTLVLVLVRFAYASRAGK